ncbi:MAG: secondary thiamine-phosphate synthase enzyme YjbQ [Candidatus Aminicenantes bacterium]
MTILKIKSQSKEEFMDITSKIRELVASSGIKSGMWSVYVPHTTAGMTINENADPSVRKDIIDTLKKMVPPDLPYSHLEGNSPAHIKASLVGSSVSGFIDDGELALGTWQGIFFCEFDGPRNRKIYVNIFSS